jgi:Protein of unknown function (DUF2591)
MKTAELTGAALDWAVARLESKASPVGMDSADILLYRSTATNAFMYKRWAIPYSTNWAQGGPIIEREGFCVMKTGAAWCCTTNGNELHSHAQRGDTPLVAAMRCYVASKLGDTVEVPSDLF